MQRQVDRLLRLEDEVPGKGGDGRLDGDVIAGRAHHGHHYARLDDRVGVGGHLYVHVVGLAVSLGETWFLDHRGRKIATSGDPN